MKQEPKLYERIGEEHTFEVDVIEPKLVKREICGPSSATSWTAAGRSLSRRPARAVHGGYASAGLLAWIAISKYVHHLPLHRLEQMSQRWGARLSRRTMRYWLEVTAQWLEPIYRHLQRGLLAGDYPGRRNLGALQRSG